MLQYVKSLICDSKHVHGREILGPRLCKKKSISQINEKLPHLFQQLPEDGKHLSIVLEYFAVSQ